MAFLAGRANYKNQARKDLERLAREREELDQITSGFADTELDDRLRRPSND
jgi:hypothetical protein